MKQIVIGIASNVEREKNITTALDQLSDAFGELFISPVYESCAYSDEAKDDCDSEGSSCYPRYYNFVVSFQSLMPINELKLWLKSAEEKQGRQRSAHHITIDMDLLLYEQWVGEFDGVTLPHGDVSSRAYVLRPLSDLLPDVEHPTFKQSYSALWQAFEPKPQLIPIDFVWREQLLSVSVSLPVM